MTKCESKNENVDNDLAFQLGKLSQKQIWQKRFKAFFAKILQVLTVMFVVSFVTFLLTYLAPVEPASAMFEAAGIMPTEEMLEAARERYGLNDPFLVQYSNWFLNCLHGDLGTSYQQNVSVWYLLMSNMAATVKMALMAMFTTLIIALPLGIIAAIKRNKFTDYAIRFLTFVGVSSPAFLTALLLIYFFSYKLNIFPVAMKHTDAGSMILPIMALTVGMVSKYTRQVRACVLEELSQDYVIGARARGVSSWRILLIHVMRNALLPLITMLALSFGYLLGGAAVVEVIFSYPGLGNVIVNAVNYSDYPVIQGFVLWVAMAFTVINITVDTIYKFADPRLRKG